MRLKQRSLLTILGLCCLFCCLAVSVEAGQGAPFEDVLRERRLEEEKALKLLPTVQELATLEESNVLQKTEFGDINWSRRYLLVRGKPANLLYERLQQELKDKGQLRSALLREAKAAAYLNFKQLLNTLVVDRDFSFKQYLDRYPELAEEMDHLWQQMYILQTRYEASGNIELLVYISWYDSSLLPNLLALVGKTRNLGHASAAEQELKAQSRVSAILSAAKFLGRKDEVDEPLSLAASKNAHTEEASGIIIKLAEKPEHYCLFPEIVDHLGKIVYDAALVKPATLRKYGVGVYVKSLELALQEKRVLYKPLIIKSADLVVANNHQCTLKLDEAEAAKLRAYPELLRSARCVWVVPAS